MSNPFQHAPAGEPPPGIGAAGAAAYDKSGVLAEYARRFGCRTVVETGLYYGTGSGMPLLEQGVVESYFALDYQRENLRIAESKVPRGRYLLGDSAVVLAALLGGDHVYGRHLLPPVLFWLDAHAISDGEGSPTVCPLLGELAAVGRWPGARESVVLIDDLQLMGRIDGWPSLAELRRAVDELAHWRRDEDGAIMYLTPHSAP